MTPANPINSSYHFILSCYTSTDIEAVISDIELHEKGYELLYAVDTYDIMENYLPYIRMELFSKGDQNYQAQRSICYDYFFGDLSVTSTILMNEYKMELIAAKNKLNKHLRDAKTVIRNLEVLKKATDNFLNDPDKTEAFLRNHLEVILLLLILNDKTYSILDEFFTFLRERLSVSEIKTTSGKHNESINNVFANCKSSHFSISLFEKYVEQNKISLLSVTDPNDRHIFLENTFRDVQAVERILRINQQFEEKKLPYTVIYLSSARKTADIFKAMGSYHTFPDPLLQQGKQHVNRNIYQYFLYDRLRKDYKDDPGKAVAILEKLRDLLRKLENHSGLYHEEEGQEEILQLLKRLFDEKSSILDNHFFYSVYEKYKTTFNEFLPDNTNAPINRKELKKIIEEIDKNIDRKFISKIYSLEMTLSQLDQTYNIVDTFWGGEEYEPEYRYGKDIVRNPYQHLPILLFMDENFDSPLKSKLYKFMNLNVEVSNSDTQMLKKCFKEIVDELTLIDQDKIYSKFLKSIITTYLNFVAQSKARIPDNQTAEEYYREMEVTIILDLERQYEIIRFQFIKLDYEKTSLNNRLEFYQAKQELLNEIIYILLWLYRRNLQEDEGIRRALAITKNEKQDPRILQGIGLCYISKAYRIYKNRTDGDEGELQELANQALAYLQAAREKFSQMIDIDNITEVSTLMIKNYISILNSIADISLRKYLLLPGPLPPEYLIINSRNAINEVKTLFQAIHLDYDIHPTYSFTEIEIEYYEALLHYGKGEMAAAHRKIFSAIFRLNTIKRIPESAKYIDAMFLNGESHFYELSNKILKHSK
ncbi:hypothetical protein GFS24_02235 [Chitinophaga sp. SYP-B3965]|uniref:hypothetical protein n=1 Tax=Chitinophaga sp. SYP-B3965 TaxID=2663120 RepID=UPI001299DA7F|nr:hypothetical protein [Chitinophaga sp. SYP-B3965]MRG43911.1 hypothetical protein [Chitinophaga sp. SYP-B3965]